MEALLPSAGDPTGQEWNSHSRVRVVAGASDEPSEIKGSVIGEFSIGVASPVPDSFSEGALSTTESPAWVKAV